MNKTILYVLLAITSISTTVLISTRPATQNDQDLFEISKNIRLMTGVYEKLNTYYVDEPIPGELMKTGIDAMLESLDPYTVYIPESKIEDYRYMTTGQYGGIGSLIQKHGEYIVISEPYENSPALKAGLKAGDVLLEVDGESVIGKTVEDMSLYLKGGPGTELTIKYKRGTEEGSVTFKREEIKIPDVPYYGMLDDKTGYVKLNSFTQTASQEVGMAIHQLKDSSNMTQLVLDLRGNGGGLLHEAVNIVNFFVPKGQLVVETKGRLKEMNREYKTSNTPIDLTMPLVVLIDDHSASASEIVSGSLQDLDRAVIIGERSYGKGLVQQTKDLEFGSMVKLTVAKYYTPSGRCIQKLDYSNKNNNGKAIEVPDSLIATFKTKNGRIVKDGRGVDPDITVPAEFLSKLSTELIIGHHIFDFATNYATKHPSIASAQKFRLTDADYKSFIDFVKLKDVNHTSESKDALEKLEEIAKEEKYFTDAEAEFEALMKKLTPSLESDLLRYKDEITEMLENEIVSRYYYTSGRLQNILSQDEYITISLEILNNSSEYNKILSGN
ncbi:MAG: S41 family peptidase [Flavobacteriales bacterium]|nr:S41 family peptidase [Flavobacteriales bacterium]MCB9196819.1 S41 family peptidase [Flavobacteriales bacterium]